jgi:uncharacterized membrane protein YgcG
MTHKLLVVAVVLCLAFSQALAAYPERSSSIMDLAKVLPAKDQASLQDSIAWFKRTTGGEMVVLTLPSWKALGVPDQTWESFSTNLFNRWGLGSASRNDGVLFMAAIKEKKLRIELGKGFSRCYDSIMKQILTKDVVPLFKETRYGAGMALGSKRIIQSLPKLCPTTKTPTVPAYTAPTYTAPSSPAPVVRFAPPTPSIPWMPLGGVALVAGALWYGLRRRSQACPNCGAAVELLSEQTDDEYLEPLGSRKFWAVSIIGSTDVGAVTTITSKNTNAGFRATALAQIASVRRSRKPKPRCSAQPSSAKVWRYSSTTATTASTNPSVRSCCHISRIQIQTRAVFTAMTDHNGRVLLVSIRGLTALSRELSHLVVAKAVAMARVLIGERCKLKSETAMLEWMRSGAHRAAMPSLAQVSDQATVLRVY